MSIKKEKENIKANNELLEYLEKQLEKTNYWLSFAEAKNGALIALNIALIVALSSIFDKSPICCTICIIIFILSSLFCLYAFFPNEKSKAENKEAKVKEEKLNLLFYGDISKITTVEKFIELVRKRYNFNVKSGVLEFDIANEIIQNSRITNKKYKLFAYAVKIDVLALIVTCIFFITA